MQPRRGHQQIDHTADLALELWAPTEEELLDEGAVAVIELLTEGAQTRNGEGLRQVCIEAVDREDRLVQWLNRVLLLAILEGFLTQRTSMTLRGDTDLAASLEGEEAAFGKILTELKSVTYHDLLLERRDEQWRARIVVDV